MNFKLLGFLILINIFCINAQQINHNRDLFDVFTPIYNSDTNSNDELNSLLETSAVTSKYDCFSRCSSRKDCQMISIKSTVCKLLSQIKYSVNVAITEPYLYQKFNQDYSAINANLINHWPFNNNLYDIVGGADLFGFGGTSAQFTKDRLNTGSSAIYLNNAYYKVPNGVYFNGDFTVTSWVKTHSNPVYCRLIDFAEPNAANGVPVNEVSIALSNYNYGYPYVMMTNSATSNNGNLQSSLQLQINKWQHLAVTVTGTQLKIYIDGKLGLTSTVIGSPMGIMRTNNYIGKSNWGGNGNADAEFDDLKIFNRSLTQSEVNMVLNSYY